MENSLINGAFVENPLSLDNCGNELLKKTNFSSKAVKSTMTTEQLITPPARVWDNIEKILDEQDNRRRNANDVIASSFGHSNFSRRKKVYLATVAGLTIVGGLVWLII
ncbi:MAG: hypothetical protein M3040_11410 [Bacteroidota bacterium]|nr:hypothetical protein [Bacteroidota bacterium]